MSATPTAIHADSQTKWHAGITPYMWLVLVVASLGWAFDTMDQWLYVLARQPALTELLGLRDPADPRVAHYSGTVQSCFIFGWATGGFLFGMIGDKLGRTRTMALTVLMYAGFTGLSGLTRNWWEFAICRVLTGMGVGGEFAAGASLVAEVFPARSRTAALGIMQACSALGNMTAGVISLTIGASPNWGWRWMFAVGVIPAFLTFIIRLLVKEPESWHDAKRTAETGGKGLGTIQDLLLTPELRRRTLAGVGLAAVGVVGFWGIGTFTPDLLRQVLNPQNDPALRRSVGQSIGYASMAQNAGAFFGILAWAVLAQRIGRRPTFLISFLGCTVMVPITFYMTSSYAAALVLFPLMGFITTSLFGGYAVYFPELFPTRLRATGTGVCYNMARYVAMLGPSAFGTLRANYGIANAAAMVSSVFLLGIIVLAFAPETKDKPLLED